jgi:hypothetical protein
VALVENLEKGDLGVAGDVDILGTVRDELHKTASHIEVMILSKKKNRDGAESFPAASL